MTDVKDPLVTAVDNLTNETTDLLVEYRNIKNSFEGSIVTAEASANSAKESAVVATNKAEEAAKAASTAAADVTEDLKATIKADLVQSASNVSKSKEQVKLAKEEVGKATEQAFLATKQAVLAKASADKAKQVSGLDTVAEAVQVALADSYQYAMTKADFDASREANKNLYAGSGFVEWGKGRDRNGPLGVPVDSGMWCYISAGGQNQIRLGWEGDAEVGKSRTKQPVVNVDGSLLHVDKGATCNIAGLPPAPDGTKSYDSATGIVTDHLTYLDPKYDNTPAADHNEAVSRCFEGVCKNGDFRLGAEGWKVIDASVNNDGLVTLNGNSRVWRDYINNKIGDKYILTITVTEVTGDVSVQFLTSSSQLFNTTVTEPFTITKEVTLDATVFATNIRSTNGGTIKISFGIRPVTSNPILTRQDLGFVESFHEDTTEKGVLLPLGNCQWGATEWEGVPLKKLTDLGVGQGYSAFGEWDAKTVGYGALISELTDAQLKKFLQHPANNIYFDAETNKLIQVRYRIRVVEGKSNDWDISVAKQGSGYAFTNGLGEKRFVGIKGAFVKPDLVNWGSGDIYMSPNWGGGDGRKHNTIGHAYPQVDALSKGMCRAIPIALVQRMNQGAYHPELNPFGTGLLKSLKGIGGSRWDNLSTVGVVTSTKTCFIFTKDSEEDANVSAVANGRGIPYAYIGGYSGRPSSDPVQYYDAVYASQIKDLRLSAHKQDVNKLRVDAERKAVAGEMRGWGKVPFTKCRPATVALVNTYRGRYYINFGEKVGINNFDDRKVSYVVNISKDNDILYPAYCEGSQIYFSSEKCETEVFHINMDSVRHSSAGVKHRWEVNDKVIIVWGTHLTPESDELPWCDIIGSSENIAITHNQGIIGEWNVGTASPFALTKKCNGSSVDVVKTSDNGVTWSTVSATIDTTKNEVSFAGYNAATDVCLIQYSTLSNFTESVNNSKVIGEVGDVLASSNNGNNFGNRLAGSVAGVINKGSSDYVLGNFSVDYSMFAGSVLHTASNLAPIHTPLQGGNSNDSGGFKALSTLTEKDGLLYLQLHGSELHYDTTANNWGDNSTIPIINGELIRTDDNGHTVKTFCHHSQIPLGIASYSDSSQSTK